MWGAQAIVARKGLVGVYIIPSTFISVSMSQPILLIAGILSGQFTFSDFVQTVKKGYWDAHIESQSNIYQLYSPTHSVKLLKMDLPDFSEKFAEILKISPESIPKTNETNANNNLSSIKPEDREYFRKKYEKDFRIFGY